MNFSGLQRWLSDRVNRVRSWWYWNVELGCGSPGTWTDSNEKFKTWKLGVEIEMGLAPSLEDRLRVAFREAGIRDSDV